VRGEDGSDALTFDQLDQPGAPAGIVGAAVADGDGVADGEEADAGGRRGEEGAAEGGDLVALVDGELLGLLKERLVVVAGDGCVPADDAVCFDVALVGGSERGGRWRWRVSRG
jgi:hypothetical protein